jgi:anti-sigma B factor antagonist
VAQAEPQAAVKERVDPSAVPGYLDFSVSTVVADGTATVVVTGDVDCYTSPQLRSTLVALVEEGARHVVLDLGTTQFVDSTGLSVLVGGLKRLREHGGTMVLKSPTAATSRLLELTGLHTVFDVA